MVRPADLVDDPGLVAVVDRMVLEALEATLGRPARASVSPADAVAAVLPQLERAHEADLDPVDLQQRVASRLGPDLVDRPEVMCAMDDALNLDQGAHAIARQVFARDLLSAYQAPESVRRERAQGVLEAERERIYGRRQARPRRVEAILKASIRLPDRAYS